MKLKSALILASAISFLVAILIIWSSLERSVRWGFESLAKSQMEDVINIIKQDIKQKQTYINHIAQLIQDDANIASSFVLAQASQDYDQLNKRLDDVKNKTGLDGIFIQSKSGILEKRILDRGYEDCVTQLENSEDEVFCNTPRGVAVVRRTPLVLYGEPAGVLLLGQLLQITSLSGSNLVNFSVTKSERSHAIESLGKTAVFSEILSDFTPLKGVINSVRNSVIFGIGLAFAVLLLLYATAWDRIFLQPYIKMVTGLRGMADKLNENLITDAPNETVGFIYENKVLAAAIRVFVDKLRDYERRLTASIKVAANLERHAALGQLAGQVAHDIRSPLSAIKLTIASCTQLPKEQADLLKMASDRISNIAEELLKKHRKTLPSHAERVNSTFLACDLERLISEKQTEQNNTVNIELNIKSDAVFLHCAIETHKLSTVISNLVNNAAEASPLGAKVQVILSRYNNLARLQIIDVGCGIPAEILPRLGVEEVTFGKFKGNGIGLTSVFQIIKELGGHIAIDSTQGSGTTIDVYFPIVQPPPWLASEFNFDTKKEIVIVDDDRSVHEVWRYKVSKLAHLETIFVRHYMSAEDFLSAIPSFTDLNNFRFFVDYDLGSDSVSNRTSGVDLILQANIAPFSVLVTAHSLDMTIINEARAAGIKIIPKAILPYL